MNQPQRTILLGALLLSTISAQPSSGPSGHWEGSIQSSIGQLNFEIDLATIRRGWEALKGLPSGAKEPLRYSLDPKPNAPPTSYQTALSPAGSLEVIVPRPEVGKILGASSGAGSWPFGFGQP